VLKKTPIKCFFIENLLCDGLFKCPKPVGTATLVRVSPPSVTCANMHYYSEFLYLFKYYPFIFLSFYSLAEILMPFS